jgi:non-specific serine/threonine protein kinase
MPEGEKITPPKIAEEPPQVKEAGFRSVFAKLRKRRIIETLAAFIGGGWLLVEVVERLLVGHYKFPEESIDLTVVSVIGALLATLFWRWFGSTEKRPGNIKVEVLLVPLIILATVATDINLVLQIVGLPGKTLLIGIVALCLGLVWVVLKLSQWAAAMPESRKKEIEVSNLSAVRPEKSIVVLPFTDLSPQKDQEYFCDGIAEEIIADLSHVHDLLVISRSSAMTFRGSSKTVREIARDLNVHYVMEGSVRKAGNDLRITAQLIEATNDAHVWAEKYSGTLDDVFDIQEKVSRSIVDALKIKLSSGEIIKISERPIDDIQAYDYYLRAKREMFAGTAEGLKQALRDLEAGLAILGENVLLNQGMAEAHLHHYEYGIKSDEETLQRAEDFTKKVMSLKPNSAEGYYLLGRIERFRGTVTKAIEYFKSALAIDPNHSSALLFLASALGLHVGKASLAEPLLRKLQGIDPLTPLFLFISGYIQWLDGKLDQALLTFQYMTKMEPNLSWGKFMTAQILAWQGNYDEVFRLADELVLRWPDDSVALWTLSLKYALRGEKMKALDTFSEKARGFIWNDPEVPWFGASLFALVDEKDEALLWLEHAIDRGWINYPLFAERNPFFANIRGEPRFKKLMDRVKYEWEHFEVLP